MADKLGLNYDVRELKLGASFTNNKASQYHTIKYDFKPASVDVNKMATVDVGTNNQVTVTVPHLDGAGVPHTVFKGNQRPYTKECILIIDRVTGEITLERLSSNIQVKKTRQECGSKARPLTPVQAGETNTTARLSSRTRVATTRRAQPPSGPSGQPGQSGPAGVSGPSGPSGPGQGGAGNSHGGGAGQRYGTLTMVRSPTRQKTSPPQAPWSAGGNSTLASLPMLGFGFDEPAAPRPTRPPPAQPPAHPAPPLDKYVERREPPAPAPAPASAPAPAPERPDKYAERREPVMERQEKYLERREPIVNNAPPVAALSKTAEPDGSSSSSSSDSDSGSGSDSDSDDDAPSSRASAAAAAAAALTASQHTSNNPSLPSDVLNDDLCLSESGSDSD